MNILKQVNSAAQVQPYNEAAMPVDAAQILYPSTTKDLVTIFAQCVERRQSVSLHATGHDFEGRSLSGEMVVHLGAFDEVRYDPETTHVTVGGGVRVAQLNDILRPHGRAVSTGTNQDVGVVGLALGGGAAYTSRLYGLTCDAIVAVELCTFGGRVLQVNDQSDPALMRLLRGAGGGWFGAVTRMVLKTYPTVPVTSFSATWDATEGRALLGKLEALLISAPDNLSMRVGANVTGTDMTRCVTLSGQFLGDDTDTIARHFGSLTRHPSWKQKDQNYFSAMAGAKHVTSGGCFRIKSRFAKRQAGAACLQAMFDHLAIWTPTTNPDGAGFGLFAWGGQISQFSAAKSCAGGRNAIYLSSFDTSWSNDATASNVNIQLDWVGALDGIAGACMTDQSYINFPDSDDIGFSSRHLAPIAAALKTATEAHDPANLGRQVARVQLRHPTDNPLAKKFPS